MTRFYLQLSIILFIFTAISGLSGAVVSPAFAQGAGAYHLKIVGTITGEGIEPFAIVVDPDTREQILCRKGDRIKGAVIKDIQRGRIVVIINGREEFLMVDSKNEANDGMPPGDHREREGAAIETEAPAQSPEPETGQPGLTEPEGEKPDADAEADAENGAEPEAQPEQIEQAPEPASSPDQEDQGPDAVQTPAETESSDSPVAEPETEGPDQPEENETRTP